MAALLASSGALTAQAAVADGVGGPGGPARVEPIDPQSWVNPEDMTWEDYRAVPGTTWADPSLVPTEQTFRGALVLADYPDQDFVVTRPAGSTVFGNPDALAADVPREDVAEFYEGFLNSPGELNRGHTINEYWMEDSRGRFGVELTGFGPYRLPGQSFEYGIDMQGPEFCPAGYSCDRDLRTDAGAAWRAEVGDQVPEGFDFVFFLSAGQDESSTWQEFGEMMFQNREDVPDEFGPPDPDLPNWSDTRYVDWTSWRAAAGIWPNARAGSSTQAESSGQGVYAHELSHILGIGDNYNNPFADPPIRSYSGLWDMMSRGTFNGPGGTHTRWLIPPTSGSAMGAHHMVRNKLQLGLIDESEVLRVDGGDLAESGLVVAEVTARAAEPTGDAVTGLNVVLPDGDLSPPCDQRTDPLCDGGGYQNYTLEVVDRMGSDSFAPDSGVLLAKTKDEDRAPFIWVIDANPEDIGLVDFYRPDGTPAMVTVGDARQLADALFKAGTGSGSLAEHVDEANRLHFYVLGLRRDEDEVLSYTVAVRSLDGDGPHRRGLSLRPARAAQTEDGIARCSFPLRNTGEAAAEHGGDVYRLSAATGAQGWSVRLPAELAAAAPGETVDVGVIATADRDAARTGEVTLTAVSESDPEQTQTARCRVIRSR
ncbi:M6 family metalloprotease domain-containing protein [Actinoalloteichus fjordicus]